MLLTLQFPICDARLFSSKVERLLRPNWPRPIPGVDFIRSFGGIKKRHRGGLQGWVGENLHCNAVNILRFPAGFGQLELSGGATVPISVAFRRFFADKGVVGKFEIGFHRNVSSFDDAEDVAAALWTQGVMIGGTSAPLLKAGKLLSDLYEKASTPQGGAYESSGLVRACSPAMIWEMQQVGSKPGPIKGQTGGTSTKHRIISSNAGYPISNWFLVHFSADGKSGVNLRPVRICVSRLHAEYECLQAAIDIALCSDAIDVKPLSTESDLFQSYLANSLKRIMRLERKASEEDAEFPLWAATVAHSEAFPTRADEITELLEKLGIRRSVLANMRSLNERTQITYMTNNIGDNNSGSIVIGSTLENVTITIQDQVSATDGLQESLRDLTEELKKIVPSLSEEKAKEAAADLEKLVEEAKREKPARKYWRVSVEGLTEAAKALGSIGIPVVKAVAAVAAILAKISV